jgi:putative signal transducing protein
VEPEQVVVVTVVPSEPEAELACGLLRSAGIKCAYRDTEAIDSPIEDFIASGPREILVSPDDLEDARQLLQDSEQS